MKQVIILAWIILLLLFQSLVSAQEFFIGGNNNNQGKAICITDDGGYFLLGTSRNGDNGSDDFHLIKISNKGQKVWEKYYGGLHQDRATWIEPLSNGDFALFGYSWDEGPGRFDYLLIRIKANGNLIWSKAYGGTHYDVGYCVKELSDGGFGMLGFSKSTGGPGDFLLVRTDDMGNEQWSTFYDINQQDYGFELQELPDGGFLLFGTSNGFHDQSLHGWFISNAEATLIRTDPDGQILWDKNYGGSEHDFGHQIETDRNGDHYLIGSTQSEGAGKFDLWYSKIDESGNSYWSRTIGGSEFEYGSSIDISENGDLFLIGTSKSFSHSNTPEVLLVKTNANGDELWSLVLGKEDADYGSFVKATPGGGCAIIGSSRNPETKKDELFFAKITSEGIVENFNTFEPGVGSLSVYPNPMIISAEIAVNPEDAGNGFQLYITDSSGRLIFEEFVNSNKTIFERAQLTTGVYFIRAVLDNGETMKGKLVVR